MANHYKKIIFVCTGNTCRSPMAEAALRAELKKRKIRWFKVESAGLAAEEGAPMSEHAAPALSEAGIPFKEDFCARGLTEKMIEEAHVSVCMTERHCAAVRSPNATSLYALAGREIPDPFGQGIDVYRVTLRLIRECLPRVIQEYCLLPSVDD